MADTIKILGQADTATTLTDVYIVPALTSTVISSVVVCNLSGSDQTFRLSVAVGGAGDSGPQYLYYDLPIEANDTFVATGGLTLAATDVLRFKASSASVSVNVFGVETA